MFCLSKYTVCYVVVVRRHSAPHFPHEITALSPASCSFSVVGKAPVIFRKSCVFSYVGGSFVSLTQIFLSLSFFSPFFTSLSQDVANHCLRPRRGLWRSAGIEASAVGRRFWTRRTGGEEKRTALAPTPLVSCCRGFSKRILFVESQKRRFGVNSGHISLGRMIWWESFGKFDDQAGDDNGDAKLTTHSRTRLAGKRCYDFFGKKSGETKVFGPKFLCSSE